MEVQDYGQKLSVSQMELMSCPGIEEYIQQRLIEMEKNAIYKAVKQAENDGGWINIKPEIVKQEHADWLDNTSYMVHVHCRPTLCERVYVPIYEDSLMPKDVFKCNWCSGYTHNDSLGHCAACGGPRDDDAYCGDLRLT